MSIALATRGVISGFMGTTGDVVYVDVPVCGIEPDTDEFGELTMYAQDMTPAPPPSLSPGVYPKPNRRSNADVLPTKTNIPLPTKNRL